MSVKLSNTDANDATNTWNLTRTLSTEYRDESKSSVTLWVGISTSQYNRFSYYSKDYESVTSDCALDFVSIFGQALSEIPDLTGDSANAMKPYFSVDQDYSEYLCTILRTYEYEKRELPNENIEYELDYEWHKGSSDIATLISNEFDWDFSITTDKDCNVLSYKYKLNGNPDYMYMSRDYTTGETNMMEMYTKLLDCVKQQVSMVFGDGVDISSLAVADFPVEYDSEGEEYPGRELYIPATLNLFGQQDSGQIRIRLSDSAVDCWRCTWAFEAEGSVK